MAKGKGTMQTKRISSLSKSQPPTQRHENYKIRLRSRSPLVTKKTKVAGLTG